MLTTACFPYDCAGKVPHERCAAALAFALEHTLAAVEVAAGRMQTAEEPHSFWSSVLSGQAEVRVGSRGLGSWEGSRATSAGWFVACSPVLLPSTSSGGSKAQRPLCPPTFLPPPPPPQISPHIPLERFAAACLAGLLHLGQTSATPGPYLAAAATALGAAPGQAKAGRAWAARRWEMCGVAAERVLAWMSQVRVHAQEGASGRGWCGAFALRPPAR